MIHVPKAVTTALIITSVIMSVSLIHPVYSQAASSEFAVNLSNNSGYSSDPHIAASGSNVYVVWTDDTPENSEIFFRASNDNGATFGDTINLSNNEEDSSDPHIAASGSNVYEVWSDSSEIFFSRSIDEGSNYEVLESVIEEPVINDTNTVTPGNDLIMTETLSDLEIVDKQATDTLEVITIEGLQVVSAYSDTILIRNNSDSILDSVRLMLSPEIANCFYLDRYSIKTIEPWGNATVTITLLGRPNTDVYGDSTGYDGEIMVMAPNRSPVMLPVKITSESTSQSHYQAYMERVMSTAQERYTRSGHASVAISSIMSQLMPSEYSYQVNVGDRSDAITSASDQLIIKNKSDRPLENIRIFVSKPSNLFLLDQQAIRSIAPNGEAAAHLISRIDGVNAHNGFSGELIIAPANGRPMVIPINIPGTVDKKEGFDVYLLSGSDAISKMSDKIVIKNNTSRPMESVRIILPVTLAKVFHLSNDSFQYIPPGGEANIDFKFRTDRNLATLTSSYIGEMIVTSEHQMQNVVIPINMVWHKISSDHFTIYARNNEKEIDGGEKLAYYLESKYGSVTQRLGELKTKTVIYVLSSNDELGMITDSVIPYHYSAVDDVGFVSFGPDLNEAGLHVLVYRSIFNSNPSYWNKEKIMFDRGNWLVDGITNYVVANMTGKQRLEGSELDALTASPELEWYNEGTMGNYAATYTFFKFLEEKYGERVVDKILMYLGSGMISNHKCSTLENCSVKRAVYDIAGFDNDGRRHDLNFTGIVGQWKDYLMEYYDISIKHVE